MEKEIKIGGQAVRLSNNVAWTMEYRDQFGKDVLESVLPMVSSLIEALSTILSENDINGLTLEGIAESLEGRAIDITLPMMQLGFVDSVVNITWAMAKAADETIAPPKQWVRQFEEFPLDEIVPVTGEMILKGFASSKNLARLKSLVAKAGAIQRSHSTQSSSPDSNEA